MGTLILHAGLPKTGTSSLQAALHSGRQQLAAAGILWPKTVASPTDPRHVFLHREPLADGNCPSLVAALLQARRDRLDTVIVSSEGLTAQSELLAHVDGKSVRAALEGWRVRMVFSLRDRAKWELSLYKQCVLSPPLHHSTNAYERTYATGEVFDVWRARPEIRILADPHSIAERLSPVFGKSEVLTFESGKDAVSSFMSAVGLKDLALPEAPRSNISPALAEIEILRRANASAFPSRLNKSMRGLIAMREDTNHIGLATYGRRPSKKARLLLASWLASIRFKNNPGLDLSPEAFEKTRRAFLKMAVFC